MLGTCANTQTGVRGGSGSRRGVAFSHTRGEWNGRHRDGGCGRRCGVLRSLTAHVQKEGRYLLVRGRNGPGRGRKRKCVVIGRGRNGPGRSRIRGVIVWCVVWGLPLTRHGGARRVSATADVRVERPERGSAGCRETRGCRGWGLGGSVVATTGAVTWGRCWGGRGVLSLVRHREAWQGRRSIAVRVRWPKRRGIDRRPS